jgi:hypothetical protein
MSFLLSCLFYASIGSLTGFFVHIFNGLVQSKIVFNAEFIAKTTRNFAKVIIIMALATLVTGALVLPIAGSFFAVIGTDSTFFHQLLFYLFAFAAFDFGLKN